MPEPQKQAKGGYPTVIEPEVGARPIMPGLPHIPNCIYNGMTRLAFYLRGTPVIGGLLGGFVESLISEIGKNDKASSVAEIETNNWRGAPQIGFNYPKEWIDAAKKKKKPRKEQSAKALSAYALLPQGYALADAEIQF